MNKENYFKFTFDEGRELLLLNDEDVFKPTGTTSALVNTVKSYLRKPSKLLDLGCGIGVTGLSLKMLGLVKDPLFASDISKKAIECMQVNAKEYDCDVIAKSGSIFDPWKGYKFDTIVNDISGVSQYVADISPWFNNVSCDSGPDGTKLTIEVLKKARNHLYEDGQIFFPVISLSDVKKIVETARIHFKVVKKLSSKDWPLPKEMYQYKNELEVLKEQGQIYFETKFGMIIWYTDIYVAYNN